MRNAKYDRLPTSEGNDEDEETENVELTVMSGGRTSPRRDRNVERSFRTGRTSVKSSGGSRNSRPIASLISLLLALVVFLGLVSLVSIILLHVSGHKERSFPWALGKGPPWQSSVVNNLHWTVVFPGLTSESAVRLFDTNDDGYPDILLGVVVVTEAEGGTPSKEDCALAGFEFPCMAGVIAVSGINGSLLWLHPTTEEVFAVVCGRLDVNEDGKSDCLVSGRGGVLEAINPRTGQSLWNPKVCRRLNTAWNVYTPVILKDVSNDNVSDLLIVNGGNQSYDPWQLCRLGAVLRIISGRTGRQLGKSLPMPDAKESYMSPVLGKVGKEGKQVTVVFVGTGGETVSGSLWVLNLHNVFAAVTSRPLSRWSWGECRSSTPLQAIRIVTGVERGVAVPPEFVDLTGDGVLDILVSVFDGQVLAVDGATCVQLWRRHFEHSEFYSSPAIGRFDTDSVPDVFLQINHGSWWLESYNSSTSMVLNGKTGHTMWTMQSRGPARNSPLSIARHPLSPAGDVFVFWTSEGQKQKSNSKENARSGFSSSMSSQRERSERNVHIATTANKTHHTLHYSPNVGLFEKLVKKRSVHARNEAATLFVSNKCPSEMKEKGKMMYLLAVAKAKHFSRKQQQQNITETRGGTNTVQLLLVDGNNGGRMAHAVDFSSTGEQLLPEKADNNHHVREQRHVFTAGVEGGDFIGTENMPSQSEPCSQCSIMSTPAIGDIDGDGHLEIAFAITCSTEPTRKSNGQTMIRIGVKTLFKGDTSAADDELLHQSSDDSRRISAAWDRDILPPHYQPWLGYLGTCATSVFDRADHHNMCYERV